MSTTTSVVPVETPPVELEPEPVDGPEESPLELEEPSVLEVSGGGPVTLEPEPGGASVLDPGLDDVASAPRCSAPHPSNPASNTTAARLIA
ncbi:MAG: hypothetical protein ACE37F_11750 [Nannocystaceae bacterium]|nr:hypothetical protein [bacterium]